MKITDGIKLGLGWALAELILSASMKACKSTISFFDWVETKLKEDANRETPSETPET